METQRLIDKLILLMTNVKGVILLLLAQVLALQGVQTGFIALGIAFTFDFITGTAASWYENKKQNKKPKIYFIESRKLRRTIIKATTYLIFIMMSGGFYFLFFDGTFGLPISTKTFTIIEITFGMCIAVECWSILENFKRLGFDIVGKITNMAKHFWKSFNAVKSGE